MNKKRHFAQGTYSLQSMTSALASICFDVRQLPSGRFVTAMPIIIIITRWLTCRYLHGLIFIPHALTRLNASTNTCSRMRSLECYIQSKQAVIWWTEIEWPTFFGTFFSPSRTTEWRFTRLSPIWSILFIHIHRLRTFLNMGHGLPPRVANT